jgi:hypothetical protein
MLCTGSIVKLNDVSQLYNDYKKLILIQNFRNYSMVTTITFSRDSIDT